MNKKKNEALFAENLAFALVQDFLSKNHLQLEPSIKRNFPTAKIQNVLNSVYPNLNLRKSPQQ